MTTSPDTLLRRVKHPGTVRHRCCEMWRSITGVAQRGNATAPSSWTSRQCVIDFLPDCDAETVAAWLKAHPEVEVVSQDHSAAYAQAGGRNGGRNGGTKADEMGTSLESRRQNEGFTEVRQANSLCVIRRGRAARPGPRARGGFAVRLILSRSCKAI